MDLGFLLIQMTDEFYPLLNSHGNTIRLELPPEGKRDSDVLTWENGTAQGSYGMAGEDITVYADREKLARVFHNILKNAIAYSYPNTEIVVECGLDGDKARIVFSNRGKTIPRQKLESIFEKFFRLDDARSTNTGGAGLGLAIAREIVTLHGGAIAADSENEVTTFTVELPRYDSLNAV